MSFAKLSNAQGPFNDPKSFREAYKRFRFSLKKSEYMDLVDEISRDNGALSRLTEQSSALETARTSRKRRPNFDKIRVHASSMFNTLQQGLRGSCKASHKASLYMKPMENESDLSNGSMSSETDVVTFRVVLYHDYPVKTQTAPCWIVEEAEVRLLESMISSGGQPPSPPRPRSGKGKKVGWLQDPKAQASAAHTHSVQQQNLEEIIDLCAGIQRYRAMQCGI